MKKIAFACLLAAAVSCSSSSTPKLESLSDLPNMDAANYDYSAVEGLTLTERISVHGQSVGEVGGFSRAACEGYTLKKQLFQDSQQLENFVCYVKELEQADIGITVGEGTWSYYTINFPDNPDGQDGPPSIVRVRVGKVGGKLGLDACIPNGDTWNREVEMRMEASADGYSGYAVNGGHYTNDEGDEIIGQSRINVAIDGSSIEDFTSAQFEAYHVDDNLDNPGFGSLSTMTFTADADTNRNTLDGANSYASTTWGTNTGQLFGQWGDDLIGTVQYHTTGEYPAPDEAMCSDWGVPEDQLVYCVDTCGTPEGPVDAVDGMCTFENTGTESFSIVNNETPPPTFSVIAPAESPYYDAVLGATLPTLDDIEDQVGWVDEWDCEAPAGESFAPVDASDQTAIVTTCEIPRDDSIWSLCQEQEEIARNLETPL